MKKNYNNKVMVAMSGGVDSSVAALLIKEQGYEVAGGTLKLFDNDDIGLKETRTCCSIDDVEDAKSVAYKLNFPHYVFNFKREFNETVIDKFGSVYKEGMTPNPCIDCNRYIKFDKMIDRAVLLGYDHIATGHYVQVEYDENRDRYLLKKSEDPSKDQTYVLYNMTQEQLSRTLFPLGTMTKDEARNIAEEAGLINARKPDSQDICFVPDGDYEKFLREVMDIYSTPGNFVDTKGNVLGQHKGFTNYTLGQRKGIGLAFDRPMYVVDKNFKDNTIVLGDNSDLDKTTMTVYDLNMIMFEKLEEPMRATVKTRYSQRETPAMIFPRGDEIYVEFDEPVRAITPGQAAVFYDGDYVIGGGTIKLD